MKYHNTRTGAVIDIRSELSGEDWQVLEPAGSSEKKEAPVQPRKKAVKKTDE